jgi:hypothetical protein
VGVARASLGRGQRHAGKPDGDRGHPDHLAPADPLSEHAGAAAEQEDEAEGERGLDEGEGGERERRRLQAPAAEAESGAGEPARPGGKPAQEREPQPLLAGSEPRLQRLQGETHAVE